VIPGGSPPVVSAQNIVVVAVHGAGITQIVFTCNGGHNRPATGPGLESVYSL